MYIENNFASITRKMVNTYMFKFPLHYETSLKTQCSAMPQSMSLHSKIVNAQQHFHSKRALSTPITSSSRLQAPLTVQNLKLLLLNSAPPTPQSGFAPVKGGGGSLNFLKKWSDSKSVTLSGRSILKQHHSGCSTVHGEVEAITQGA